METETVGGPEGTRKRHKQESEGGQGPDHAARKQPGVPSQGRHTISFRPLRVFREEPHLRGQETGKFLHHRGQVSQRVEQTCSQLQAQS